MAVLKQDHFAYEEFRLLDTVVMGHEQLYAISKERNPFTRKRTSPRRTESGRASWRPNSRAGRLGGEAQAAICSRASALPNRSTKPL
jgi:ATPase subunit of ABC transporter with duplicated ATPase domains